MNFCRCNRINKIIRIHLNSIMNKLLTKSNKLLNNYN